MAETDAIAERLVGNVPRDEEFGATYWSTKKRLLAQEYGIDWKQQSESVNVTLIERRFSGDVWAWAGKDDDTYQFVLEGHRDTWHVKSFGILEF